MSRRPLIQASLAAVAAAIAAAAATAAAAAAVVMSAPAAVIDPSWAQYPYVIVPGIPQLTLPAGDGLNPQFGSDTWYVSGVMEGQTSHHHYAFMTIYNKNRLGASATGDSGRGLVRADFYQYALFDLDTGAYGTFTEFDFPPATLKPGAKPKLSVGRDALDLSFKTAQGDATWINSSDADGQLVPFAQHIELKGQDQSGKSMQLSADITATHAPFATGADVYNGVIICFGQPDTIQFGQGRSTFAGNVKWGDVSETVVGNIAHYDRQMFPQYAGVDTGLLSRQRSHQWINLWIDDGTDLSIWFQYLRTERNAIVPYTGITGTVPGTGRVDTFFTADVKQEIYSYVRFPFSSLPDAFPIPVPSQAIYMPARHRIVSDTLRLDMISEALVPNPGHVLPVPYTNGPARWTGTYQGLPATAVGFHERTLGLYRDWELVQVLRDSVGHLPSSAYASTGPDAEALIAIVDGVTNDVDRGRKRDARNYLAAKVKPALETLQGTSRTEMLQVYTDLLATLR